MPSPHDIFAPYNQQHLDDDGRVQDDGASGGAGKMRIELSSTLAPLRFSEGRVAVKIEVEPAHPLSL